MYLSLKVESIWVQLANELQLTIQDDCIIKSDHFILQPMVKYFSVTGDMAGRYSCFWIKITIINPNIDSMNLKWYRRIQYILNPNLKAYDFSKLLINDKLITQHNLEYFKLYESRLEIFSSLSISNEKIMRELILFILAHTTA